jgi:hypothetical protein
MADLRYDLCPTCGLHGRFVSDLGDSEEFASQQEAIRYLETALQRGKVDAQTAVRLAMRIKGTAMKIKPGKVGKAFRDRIRQWNLMRTTTNAPERLKPDDFHVHFPP